MSRVSRPGADAVGIDGVGADAVRAVVERVLAGQREQRRLGQAVGAEIRSGIDRLFRHVEQKAAAGALRQHDLDRGLRDALMAVEIQLKTLAQDLFVDFADAALPGGAGIRHDDIDAAEMCGDRVEGRMHRGRIGHVAFDRQGRRADLCACSRAAARLTSSSATSAPAAAKALAVAVPMAPAAPVIGGDLTLQRRFLARAELFLLQRPIFAIEHVGFGDRLEFADRLGVADAFDPGLGEIGGDDARPSWWARGRTGRDPAPGRRGAGDRAPA